MSVFGLLSGVAGFVKVRYLIDKAIIDNMIFRCHYRITSAMLFVCCMVVTANNLIGDPISCIHDGGVPGHVINTYCWITYTFTLPGEHGKKVGTEVAQSGLGNDNQEKIYHSYYQWVPFTLFMQVGFIEIERFFVCVFVQCEILMRTFFICFLCSLYRAVYSMCHIGSGRTGKMAK